MENQGGIFLSFLTINLGIIILVFRDFECRTRNLPFNLLQLIHVSRDPTMKMFMDYYMYNSL